MYNINPHMNRKKLSDTDYKSEIPLEVKDILTEYERFVPTTAEYPEDRALDYLIAGLAGETGQVASTYSKYVVGDYDHFERNRRFEKELGDILWFIASICKELRKRGVEISIAKLMFSNMRNLLARKIKDDGENR